MDIADEAALIEEQNIKIALLNRKPPVPETYICSNGDCGEPSLTRSNYCSPECREDAEKIQRARNMKVGK